MCLYPQFIKNRKYTKTKKNGGLIPAVSDRRTEYVPTGCGNCKECRKQNARQWQARLTEDIKTHTNGIFVTLTFSNESILHLLQQSIRKTDKQTGAIVTTTIQHLHGYEKDNAIATKAIRLFNERWRKQNKKAVRHWLVTELGHNGTENIHLHGIIWTNDHTQIKKHWQYGYIWDGYTKLGKRINYVNTKTINYIVKYINKVDPKHKEYKSKVLCSPGIGKNFINTFTAKQIETELHEYYRTPSGHKINLPIYWRNKLFTDDTKERLWLQRLDKQERWLDGIRIDISKNENEYNKAIKEARIKNKELGYGQRPNENRKKYEEHKREIMITTRIKKARQPNND